MALEHWLIGIAAALFASIVGSRLATRLGIPALLLFLVLGMLAGSDGPGGIWFSDAQLAQNAGVVALVFILFSGGMDLDWTASKTHVWKAASLSTVGVIGTTALVGVAAWALLPFSLLEGLLLGAIVASTDAAAVFSVLSRASGQLRPDIKSVLEMESGSNDPAAVFLTVLLLSMLQGQSMGIAEGFAMFAWQMGMGGVLGWLAGMGGAQIMRRLRLDYDGMYHGLSIAVMLTSFAGTALLGANGFLAVYIAGVAFGNGDFRQKKGLRRFHDGLAWLMQIMLFLVLGLLVFPHQLVAVAWFGVALSALLMFVGRPLGVAAALLPFRVGWREQILISWCGLRGGVPIVLATFPLLAGIDRAQEIFNIVFFVVLLSAALQGPTIPLVAKWLGLNNCQSPAKDDPAQSLAG